MVIPFKPHEIKVTVRRLFTNGGPRASKILDATVACFDLRKAKYNV
jgi:hypothetical protein